MSPPPSPENPKLKVREVIQSGFCNISPHPPSVPSFSQIGWPQRLASGKLSQTVTLQCLVYIFTLFTLGSIYSTNASGAEQMPDASVAEDLNSERPWTNPTSGQSETWTRGLRIVSLRSCPLPIIPLCLSRDEGMIHFFVGSHVKKPESGLFSDWIGNNKDDLRCSNWPKCRHPLVVVDFSLHFCLRNEQWIHTRVRYEISAGSVFLNLKNA